MITIGNRSGLGRTGGWNRLRPCRRIVSHHGRRSGILLNWTVAQARRRLSRMICGIVALRSPAAPSVCDFPCETALSMGSAWITWAHAWRFGLLGCRPRLPGCPVAWTRDLSLLARLQPAFSHLKPRARHLWMRQFRHLATRNGRLGGRDGAMRTVTPVAGGRQTHNNDLLSLLIYLCQQRKF